MLRLILIATLSLTLTVTTNVDAQEYFQQFVHYTIKVRLDPDKHMLAGTESISYFNNSPDTLRQFYLHLYPNGYRSKDSALLTDYARRVNYVLFELPSKHRGYLDIADVKIDGTNVTPDIDDTIAKIDLPEPLPPGASMQVELRFEEKIREHLGRAGYRGNHYDFAQWYPKVVVYDENGFHPDKFESGEFYGEFGTFDVHIDVPDDYVIAATGVVQDGDPGWGLNPPDEKGARSKGKDKSSAYKTVHFHAENVHDFAWSADPTFVVQDTTVAGVDIRSFYRSGNHAWKDSTLAHGVRAVKWLTEKVGEYPYPQVSIVDALLGGGMEYPMLVMDGRVSEGLVLHEVGHIYFFGILGNDEREEAWLDEGFTTFQSTWYQLDRYGDYGLTRDWNWYQRMTPQYNKLQYLRSRVFPLLRQGYGERVATPAHEFQNDYYTHVYRKAALMFFALRYVVGEDTFDRILREYYDRWKLKHVNEARFQQVCEEISGTDLDWFFEEWLHTKKICDYRLSAAETDVSASGDGYTCKVKIERLGEVIMPLVLEFRFADGSSEVSRIDGRLRTIEKSFELPERPAKVSLNPANEIADIRLSDNFIPRRRARQIDWPNNYHYPEDAYQIRYRPGVWYNDVDQLKAGLHLRGSYANWFRRIKLGIYYGTNSERLDFSAGYESPFRLFGKNSTLSLSAYKMEGREDFTMRLDVRKRPTLIHPPTQTYTFGLNYHDLANSRYVANPETYQEEPDFAPFFGYSVDPQFDIASARIDLNLRIGREWFGGEYEYSTFTSTTTLRSRPRVAPFDFGLRTFLGFVGGSMPFQQKLSLAGGGPLAEDARFFLRSPGAIWDEAHYHEPGQGNLRGYREGSFGVNQLATVNLEIGHSIPLLSRTPNKFLGTVKTYAFLDAGRTFDSKNPIGSSTRVEALVDDGLLDRGIVDAGVGFTLHRVLPFYDMFVRFDIPFYVNQPEINGETDETKYRYVLSLSSSF